MVVDVCTAHFSRTAHFRSPLRLAPAGPALASVNMGDASYVRAVSLINERRYDEALLALDKARAERGLPPTGVWEQ